MKIQLDETEIIARAFQNMIEDGRTDEIATSAGKVIASVAMMYEDPDGFLDEFISYARRCTDFVAKELEKMDA